MTQASVAKVLPMPHDLFGAPDLRSELVIEINPRGRCGRRRIRCESFPSDSSGAYVIRFADRTIGRLQGESPVLRIGDCEKLSFRDRFRSYNNKCDVVTWTGSLSAVMRQWENGRTEAHVMSLLCQLSSHPLAIDFYVGRSESEFLDKYLDTHWELPPLNFSRRIPRARQP